MKSDAEIDESKACTFFLKYIWLQTNKKKKNQNIHETTTAKRIVLKFHVGTSDQKQLKEEFSCDINVIVSWRKWATDSAGLAMHDWHWALWKILFSTKKQQHIQKQQEYKQNTKAHEQMRWILCFLRTEKKHTHTLRSYKKTQLLCSKQSSWINKQPQTKILQKV